MLNRQEMFELKKSLTEVYVVPIGGVDASAIVAQLRKGGINSDVDLLGRGLSKCIKYADAYDIPYVLFVGEDEIETGKFKLKDLKSGEESFLTVDGVVEKLTR